MAPTEPVRLQVALTDVTDTVMVLGEAGDVGQPQSTPPDADVAASVQALDAIRSLITSLGGGMGSKSSIEHGRREGAVTRQEIQKTLAAFEDGIVGRSFVASAWPLAERWLANKESRKFRIKYGEVVVDLRGPEDVERALDLMRDAVGVPPPRPGKKAKKPAARARGKKPGTKALKKAPAKGRAKASAKANAKATAKKRAKAARKRPARRKR